MGIESGTYINSLVATNPTSNDPKSEGDNHIRLMKAMILASFPNISGAMTASHTELNYMAGATTQPAMKDGSNLTTPTAGDNSTKIATTAFVAAASLTASLPGQTGNSGKFISTDGTTAFWTQVYPALTSNSGKFLTNNGSVTSWSSIDSRGSIFIDKGNSGTTAQVLDYSLAENYQITITGSCTISATNWPAAGRRGFIMLDLVNGGLFPPTLSGITIIKVDGTTYSSFSAAGITLLNSGINYCLLFTRNGGATTYMIVRGY